MGRLILVVIILLLVDFYAFQSFKSVIKNNWLAYIYVGLSVFVLSNFFFQVLTLDRTSGFSFGFYIAVSLFILFFVPKMILVIGMLLEDLYRIVEAGYRFLFNHKMVEGSGYFSSRRKFIGQLALGLAAIPFGSILHGIFRGKYNFKVLKYTLYFEDLPDAFDGYRITQISDIHSGSFDSKSKVSYAVDLVNEQQSDLILFTGDMVNNKAEEMQPWKSIFSKLNAKDGMYSILGNHDYGDYIEWESEEAKAQNLRDLGDIQKEMGFDLLLNESRFIEKNGERIAIVGVENWGKGFKQKGDLEKAATHIDANDFKILMSHDPTHWQEQVIDDDYHYHLTLSGHTHGMQFGIEIPGWIKWSPVKWRYKYWAGIYKEKGQYINVNRGFGFLAFPGRVGIWPEITVIEFKKNKHNV